MAEEEGLTPLERARISAERQRQREEDARAAVSNLQEIREAEAEAAESRRGHLLDVGAGVLRAPAGAFEEAMDGVASLDEWLGRKIGVIDFNPFDGDGIGLDEFDPEKHQSPFRKPEEGWKAIRDSLPEPERVSGNMTEAVGRFLIGFYTGKRILRGAGLLQGGSTAANITNAAVAGAFSDATVFDGHEGRLSDLIQSVPALQNPVTEYLETDENDSELESRIKNVLEGGGLGVLFDGVILGLRSIRNARAAKAAAEAEEAADDIKIELPDARALDDAAEETPRLKEEPDAPSAKDDSKEFNEEVKEQGNVRDPDNVQSLRESLELNPEQLRAFKEAVEAGDEEGASKVLKDFNEDTFDWDSIESGDDIKRIFSVTEEMFAKNIDDVKGGVQSNARTKMLANLVGSSAEEVSRLFRDVRGDKGIAARFYAAQRINLASAKRLIELGNHAKKTKAPADEAAFLRQLQIHAAIQAEVKGAQTEIARALQAMNILKQDAAENFKEFEELRRTFGGNSNTARQFERFMDHILGARDAADLNARVRMTPWERAKNVFIEYTINAMLSSAKTHVINLTSNVLNTFVYTGDRALGGVIRRLTAGDKAALREARIDLVRKFSSLDEAWKLAKQAWKDGAPVVDKRQRIEFQTRRAIAMEGSGWIAKTVNLLGDFIRIPGRALITGDEFFKAINRNSEMSVLAFRQADREATESGLEYGSKKYESAVEKRMKQLLDPNSTSKDSRRIQAEAIEKSRRVTFQESPRTSFGAASERWVNSNRFVKLIIAPFFRTPMNILRQGLFDRTPLSLTLQETREILRHGDPRAKAEVIARMTTGMAAMSTFYMFVGDNEQGNFEVVGKIPWDSSKKASNVRDYSIRIGDRWYQFNRLEPMGMWLGMIADMKTHAKAGNDEGTFAAGQAAFAAFMNNVTNKTWMQSLSDFQDMARGISTGKTATAERAINRFIGGEFGKLVPQLFKSTGRAVESGFTGEDPTAREAWTVMDQINSQLPVLNKDLPPQHDVLGRVERYEGGFKEIANPWAQSGREPNVIDDELWRLNFTMRPMRKSIGGGKLELTAEEYSELTGLVNDTGLEDILETMITGDGWDNLRDGQKIALIKEQVSEARRRARVLFLSKGDRLKRFTQADVNAKLFLDEENL